MDFNCCFELRRQLGAAESKAVELCEKAQAACEEKEALHSDLLAASQRMEELKASLANWEASAAAQGEQAAKREIELNNQIARMQRASGTVVSHGRNNTQEVIALNTMLGEATERVAELEEELAARNEEAVIIDEEHTAQTTALTKRLRDVEAIAHVFRDESAKLEEEKKRLARTIDTDRATIAQITTAMASLENELEARREDIKTKDGEIGRAVQAYNVAMAEIATLKEELMRALGRESAKSDECMFLEKEIVDLRTYHIKQLENNKADLKTINDNFNALNDTCNEARRDRDQKANELMEVRARLMAIVDASKEEMEKLGQAYQDVDARKEKELADLREELAASQAARVEDAKEAAKQADFAATHYSVVATAREEVIARNYEKDINETQKALLSVRSKLDKALVENEEAKETKQQMEEEIKNLRSTLEDGIEALTMKTTELREARVTEQEMTIEIEDLRTTLDGVIESRNIQRDENAKKLNVTKEEAHKMNEEIKTLNYSLVQENESRLMSEHQAAQHLGNFEKSQSELQQANRVIVNMKEAAVRQKNMIDDLRKSLSDANQKITELMQAHHNDKAIMQQDMQARLQMEQQAKAQLETAVAVAKAENAKLTENHKTLALQIQIVNAEYQRLRNTHQAATEEYQTGLQENAKLAKSIQLAKEANQSLEQECARYANTLFSVRRDLENETRKNAQVEQSLVESEERLDNAEAENMNLRFEVAKLTAREDARKAKKEARFNQEYETVAEDDCDAGEEAKEESEGEAEYELVDDVTPSSSTEEN